jgi:phage terminase small subunit
MRKLPTEVKEMQGTLEKSRVNPNEVNFSRCEAVPEPPEGLDSYGERVWYNAAQELLSKKLLFTTDLPQLEAFCQAAQFARMSAKELKEGQEAGKLTKMKNWFKYWKDSAEMVNKLGGKFGFNPVDKSNISIPVAVSGKQSLFK